jgi:hypothetical protein
VLVEPTTCRTAASRRWSLPSGPLWSAFPLLILIHISALHVGRSPPEHLLACPNDSPWLTAGYRWTRVDSSVDHVWTKVGAGFRVLRSVMSTQQPPASKAVRPLIPVYPFNEPGQPIALHDGPVGGLAPDDAPGMVVLSCIPDPRVV